MTTSHSKNEVYTLRVSFFFKDGWIEENMLEGTLESIKACKEAIAKNLDNDSPRAIVISGSHHNPDDFVIIPQENISYIKGRIVPKYVVRDFYDSD